MTKKTEELAPIEQPGNLAETAGLAAAAQVEAAVNARYKMALHRPRDWDKVRVDILKECRRPGFAGVARYAKPIGKKLNEQTNQWEDNYAEGFSIRFVEGALRCMTNVFPEVSTVYDDMNKRIVRVSVTDLEANVTYATEVAIEKTVERSDGKGRIVKGSRTNTRGKPVYIVVATEDEMLMKQSSLVSKALRGNGLRLMPGDLLDDALAQIIETLDKADAQDPDAARKGLVDWFARVLNVLPDAIKEYLGHEVAAATPQELSALRKLGIAIKDGEANWHTVMEELRTERTKAATPPPGPTDNLGIPKRNGG